MSTIDTQNKITYHPAIHELITSNTEITQGPECDIDVVFFKVNCVEINREMFEKSVLAWHGTYGTPTLNLFDGKVYNYIEIGTWLGDQQVALRMMALGAYLEVWRLITPDSVFSAYLLDPNVLISLAKVGLITIVVEPPT